MGGWPRPTPRGRHIGGGGLWIRIAAAQAHAAWGDPAATTGIVTHWIEAAADDDVQLVAFGETFLGGYPVWVDVPGATTSDDPAQKRAFARYLDGAVELAGPEIARIRSEERRVGKECRSRWPPYH